MNDHTITTQCSLPSSAASASPASRERLLDMARSLDRMGRQTEQFLTQQLQELADAITDFEQEKAAWRRQVRREAAELTRQREELEGLQAGCHTSASGNASWGRRRSAAETAARHSGDAPLSLILQPQNASPLQVSVLFFEISKLNRDMGGQGVRFEIADVRLPRRRLLARAQPADGAWPTFLFHAFPMTPLKARGSHVVLAADNTDRVEQWIAFKARTLQTTLALGDLVKDFGKCQSAERSPEVWAFIREAVRRPGTLPDLPATAELPALGSPLAVPVMDYVRQQVQRLESCFDRLSHDTGLKAQFDC